MKYVKLLFLQLDNSKKETILINFYLSYSDKSYAPYHFLHEISSPVISEILGNLP